MNAAFGSLWQIWTQIFHGYWSSLELNGHPKTQLALEEQREARTPYIHFCGRVSGQIIAEASPPACGCCSRRRRLYLLALIPMMERSTAECSADRRRWQTPFLSHCQYMFLPSNIPYIQSTASTLCAEMEGSRRGLPEGQPNSR